ncbi:hypothetical protein GFL09_18770 [Pseudomonas stutzeri]|uniref:Uncharacterized protein n=1 Tax=Stutzerimonas stutzeri KOS6 TaxID=1218352 RepID=A0A061JVL8_STUST|nr:hypothetical protein [Stutzerimonas stutzeri]EWC42655.1 hypothetical protein B597_004400 [Stutzerimonas stutzeri KOS6]MBK3869695.1 hypothetical protein [Stutzerimonas stutzeri]
MSTETTSRTPLVLADGYSYTELIPVRDASGAPDEGGFIRIFHALFSPDEEQAIPEPCACDTSLTASEQG